MQTPTPATPLRSIAAKSVRGTVPPAPKPTRALPLRTWSERRSQRSWSWDLWPPQPISGS